MQIEKKQRVLIPIVGQGSLIHIIRTGLLEKVTDFIHPVIGFAWNQTDIKNELIIKGYEVVDLPKYEVESEYTYLRSKISIWYKNFLLKSPTNKILPAYLDLYKDKKSVKKSKIINNFRIFFFKYFPFYIKKLIREEREMILKQKAYSNYENWLNQHNIDSIFTVTPFLSEIELLGRILKQNGKNVMASIHSFDNITTRQWPSFYFDHYLVWNDFNKKELERINPSLKNGKVTVCGAPQFDFHFKKNFVWSREEWLEKLGLPKDKKVILYGGGPMALFKDEPQYLEHLNQAFIEGKIDKQKAIILFRSHPLDEKDRWRKYVGESPFIVYDAAQSGTEKFDYTNVEENDLKRLISTICHADVQINFTSTMTVDGCAFYKPQIGPYYTEIKKEERENLTRQMYYQEHYMHITNSKGINLANSKDEFIFMVNDALENPKKYTKYCDDCLNTLITYKDGQSTQRVVEAIKEFYIK